MLLNSEQEKTYQRWVEEVDRLYGKNAMPLQEVNDCFVQWQKSWECAWGDEDEQILHIIDNIEDVEMRQWYSDMLLNNKKTRV